LLGHDPPRHARTSTSTPVIQRLERLRTLAQSDPHQAQVDAVGWLTTLGKADDRAALAELFGQGVGASPCTRTEGLPLTPWRDIPLGRALSQLLAVHSPWNGKTFFPDGSGGENRVEFWTLPLLLSLRTPFRREGIELIGFRFDTTIERGVLEPFVDVLAFDYAPPAYRNPRRPIPLTSIRDEIVEILPHTYLGRIAFESKPGEWVNVGYFACMRPVDFTEA
jgi:hypothetical protein